eukprot:symbB.v1.2.004855.t2/scaffold280.1/size241228/5
MRHMEECEQRKAEADTEIEASHQRLEEAKKQVQNLKQQLQKRFAHSAVTTQSAMSWRLAHPGDKTQLEAPPIPQEWKPAVKSMVFEGQPVFLGSRCFGRNMSSPYNWPTTNATPVHERKGPEWQPGGALYNYSRGIDTR